MYDFPHEAYLTPGFPCIAVKPTPDDLGFAILDAIVDGELEEIDIPTTHHFTDELYGRQSIGPKDSVIVTVKHRSTHMSIALRGHCTVVDEEGNRKEIHAPGIWITPAGTQRSIYCHTEIEWITVHPNPCGIAEVEAMEAAIFMNTLIDYRQLLADKTGNHAIINSKAAKLAAPSLARIEP